MDYRNVLKRTLEERKRRNPSYSMRAFASQLGVTQAALSQIFSRKRNLSIKTASRIVGKMQLGGRDADLFLLMVQLERTTQPQLREVLIRQVNALQPKSSLFDLDVETFRCISDWYHLALRNLVELDDLDFTIQEAARRLGISAIEAETALDRLLRLKLIEPHPSREGSFRKTRESLRVQSAGINASLRTYHRQMLQKAIDSLETQSSAEKFVGSETFAVSEDCLPEATEIIERFFAQMIELSRTKKKKTRVYHLGVQFFNLTTGSSTKTKKGSTSREN